jgi:hypothetical protein
MEPGEDPEFDLRHDHNSLLGNHIPRFTNWTDEYWVPADKIVEYMTAFQKPQVQEDRVRFCHEVNAVSNLENCDPEQNPSSEGDASLPRRFSLDITAHSPCTERVNDVVKATRFHANLTVRQTPLPGAATAPHHVCCGVVVMAHGMSVPNIPGGWIEGLAEHSVGYDELDAVMPKLSDAHGKSILILGSGNAAMETVDNLRNFAADLQVAARRVADSQARDTKCAPTPSASVVYILNSDRHYKEV